MFSFLLLCLISNSIVLPMFGHEIRKEGKGDCEGIHVNGSFHKKVVLAKGLNRPYQLAYDQTEHRIYFSYNTGEDDEDAFGVGYIGKNHTRHNITESVENGFAIAIDNNDKVIYFGGSGGVYRQHLNKTAKKIENIISTHDVWDMFYKNHLYFINFPFQHLYKYNIEKSKAEKQKHIHEKIYQFAIDRDDDVFITNETGLFMIKNNTDHRRYLEGPVMYRAIEINNKGIAHFSGQNGVYVANKHNGTLHKIAHVKNIFGIAFDKDDHVIYSDPHEIVKLIPEKC